MSVYFHEAEMPSILAMSRLPTVNQEEQPKD